MKTFGALKNQIAYLSHNKYIELTVPNLFEYQINVIFMECIPHAITAKQSMAASTTAKRSHSISSLRFSIVPFLLVLLIPHVVVINCHQQCNPTYLVLIRMDNMDGHWQV